MNWSRLKKVDGVSITKAPSKEPNGNITSSFHHRKNAGLFFFYKKPEIVYGIDIIIN